MPNRKEKIKELLDNFASLKRGMVFRGINSSKLPRITPSQWGVLMSIEHSGKTSVKDIALSLHISSSAITQLIDGLVESGYVIRKEQEKDRRAVILTLSQKTKNQVQEMKKQMVENFLNVFKVLTDVEFNQYCVLNKKVVQSFLNKSHN